MHRGKFNIPQCNETLPETDSTWTVIPSTIFNTSDNKTDAQHHKNNKIKTTKYTIFSFLPRNLFEQFHRFANVYFLFIIILNWIPAVNAFGKEIAMIPLIFVLAVTAIKDLIEDRQRYNSDKVVNNRLVSVYDSDTDKFPEKKWANVEVGDIIKLYNNDIIPADILVMNSSDENGLCHVSTANLDGETNLKQKQIPKGFFEEDHIFKVKEDMRFQVKCEKPNNQLHSFYGYIVRQDGGEVSVDKNNLLLRGCVLKNTEYLYGLVIYAGHDTKAMLNNSGPRYKRSRLEKDINKDVFGCIVILFTLCLVGAIGTGYWTSDHKVFEDLITKYTADSPAYEAFLRFLTFIIILQVIIPISLYVSVEIVKLGQVFFINQDIGLYYKETAQYPVCRATNINEDLGQIQYVFSDKTGTLTENKMVFKKYSVAGKSLVHPEGNDEEDTMLLCEKSYRGLEEKHGKEFMTSWDDFFTILTICNTVVVSSAPEVISETLETSADFTFAEEENGDARIPNGAVHKKYSLPNNALTPDSDLGVNDIPRSRTMAGPDVVIEPASPQSQDEQISYDDNNDNGIDFLGSRKVRVNASKLSDRLSRSIGSINSWLNYGLVPTYEYESPDEGALVKAAGQYNYKLANRTPEQIFFTTPDGEIKIYDILQVLAFDSARKRMSIIIRDDKGLIKVFCKGADTAILSRLKDGQEEIIENTDEHLESFAKDGLRTLCIAKKDLTEDEYESWMQNHKRAEVALTGREEKLAQSAEAIENGFVLLGATGIDDRLQEGVPETIASLRYAGIKLWILTGDKQETAVNIGFSCKLLDSSMEIITINSPNKEQCEELLKQIKVRLDSNWPSYTVLPTNRFKTDESSRPPLALIIDGITLSYTLQKPLDKIFIEIARRCESVICCRAAPLQKAAVVRLVRENLKVMTLAIGDGANDVSMLQTAEIGVGIAGQEGVQAVMASDFVLGRFYFLKRLLLLHGFWCYERISRMILYFFYKNAMFVALLFWYQIFNGFSGSNTIDDLSLILYNLAFTSLPPIFNGIFDQCLPEKEVFARPILYQLGQLGKAYTRPWFWVSILDAFYQSLILFFIPYFTFRDLPGAGMLSMGVLFHQLAVVTANLHVAIETPNWTIIHAVIIIGSVVISFLYYFIYCIITSFHVYWVIFELMAHAEFWLLLIICPTLAVMPRLVLRVFQTSFYPSVLQRVKSNLPKTDDCIERRDMKRFGDEPYISEDNHTSTST